MSFTEAIQNRYTTKMYDNTKKIDHNTINDLKEILRLSPSSINSQPWKFTFVSNPKVKEQLAEASFFNADRVKDCDTLVIFQRIDNIQLIENHIYNNLSERVGEYYDTFLKPSGQENIKNWMSKQVYLSLGVFLSACAEMQIDSTPMEGIEPEKYDQILGDNNYSTLFAVAIGYRNSKDDNQLSITPKSRLAKEDVIAEM